MIPTPDPLSTVSSSINATIKILEVTYQLLAVDEQTADLLSTTRHVDFMVREARRLRRLKAGLLNNSERTMIDQVISDTEDALRAVAKLVEPCRVDKATKNSIRFGHRVMWIFRDNPSVRHKHQKLQVCYQSLTIAFTCLYSKDVVVIAPAPEGRSEEQPPPYDPQAKELLDWQNRRKGRKSLADKEGHSTENISLINEGPNDVSIDGPLVSCLVPIPLEEDGGIVSPSTQYPGSPFELPTTPTTGLETSALYSNDENPTTATALPEANGHFPPVCGHDGGHDSYPCDEIRSSVPTINPHVCKDYASSLQYLPEIDSPSFATMLASYPFNNNDEANGTQVGSGNPTRLSFSARDQTPTSSAFGPNSTPLNASSFPKLAFSAVATPTSSRLDAANNLGLRWLESSSDSLYRQQPTEASSPGQYPQPARSNSDIQVSTAYQSDRLDAIARAEDVMTSENRAVSVGQGIMKRGGRSWLAYHATRSDMGHGMDWKD